MIDVTGSLKNTMLNTSGQEATWEFADTMKNKISVAHGKTLRFYAEQPLTSAYAFRVNLYDSTGKYVSRLSITSSPYDWMVPDGVSSILVSYPNAGAVSLTDMTPIDVRLAALEAKLGGNS